MPYSTPVLPPAPLPIHSTGRPGHRRAYTAPSSGPGAFAPLGILPRRRPRKTVFHLSNDDDDDDDDDTTNSPDDSHDHDDDDVLHNVPPALKLKPNNSLRLAIYTEDDTPVPVRTSAVTSSTTASVPFPTCPPHYSPPMNSIPTPPSAGSIPSRPTVPRTTSTPIFLSNGKPLKSSLKSSSSSPHITLPSPTTPTAVTTTTQPLPNHLRARSAPSTPNIDLPPVHKNVHFPSNEDGGLATVRIFNRSGKPASLSRPNNGDDTETETEGELSTGSGSTGFIRGASAMFPFPRSPLSQDKPLGATAAAAAALASSSVKYEVDPAQSSPIPATNPPSYANVHLESLSYNVAGTPNGKIPPGLSGTLLVRNIAYEKQVAVRFTLDDWQTTSEVSAKHLSSLPALPSSFSTNQQLTFGDIIALPTTTPTAAVNTSVESPQWDRFTFHIKLEDYAFKLAQRTLYLVVRYTAGGLGNGSVESWDNNSGSNYKIAFREASTPTAVAASKPIAIPQPNPRGRVFAVSSPPSFAPLTPPTPPTTTQPHHAQMIAQTTLLRLRKLNLRNYAAPNLTIPGGRVTATPGAATTATTTAAAPSSSSSSTTAPSSIGGGGIASSEAAAQGGVDGNAGIGGFPLRVVNGGPTTTTTTGEGDVGSDSGSESEDEDDEVKTPTGRTRAPSPTIQDPAAAAIARSNPVIFGSGGKHRGSPPPMIPFLTFSSSSSAESSLSSTPPSGNTSPHISIPPSSSSLSVPSSTSRGGLDVHRPEVLSPLEMGTSPPFSMMADLGPNFTTTKRKDYQRLQEKKQQKDNDSSTTTPSANAPPVYWPWGMMMMTSSPVQQSSSLTPTSNATPATEQLPLPPKSEEEVRKVLAGIREKSTSSPVRRVSPSSGLRTPPGSGRSSPVKEASSLSLTESSGSGKAGSSSSSGAAVVSPQPQMPNWSKAGSGWNHRRSGSPSIVTAAAMASSHPRASPVHVNMTTMTTTPPNTSPAPVPAPVTTTTTTTNHQDSVYQAFVRQWCFAQGPSHVPGQQQVPPVVHSTAPARYGGGRGTGGGGAGGAAAGGASGGSEKGAAATGGGQLVV